MVSTVKTAGENCVVDKYGKASRASLKANLGIDPEATSTRLIILDDISDKLRPWSHSYDDMTQLLLIVVEWRMFSCLGRQRYAAADLTWGRVWENLKHRTRFFWHSVAQLEETEPLGYVHT